jgi:hypothetical protein
VSYTSHAATGQAAQSPEDAGQELSSASGQAILAANRASPGRSRPVIQATDPRQGCNGSDLSADQHRAGNDRVFCSGYPGVPGAVGRARRDVTLVLDGCPATANVILCLSELATNAVTHSRSGVPGGHFTVAVDLRCGEYVKVTVTDDGGPWAECIPDGDITYRHGLRIVQDLSAWVCIDGDDAGRAVWFLCGWTAA